MVDLLHNNGFLLTNPQDIICYYGLPGLTIGKKMDTELKATFWYFGIIFSAFIAASRLIPKFHAFLGSSSGVSQLEIYLLLFISGIILYLNLKMNKQKKQEEQDIEEMYNKITNEYTKDLDEKMELIKLIMSNTDEKINRIDENIRDINESLVTLASHIKN